MQDLSKAVKKAVPEWLQDELVRMYTVIKRDWQSTKALTKKEFEVIKDVALIDYPFLRNCVGNLNIILRSCNKDENEKVLFGLRRSDTNSIFWKATTRVLCLKINIREKAVMMTRYMTIGEFWRLRASILEEVKYKNLVEGNIANEFQLINHEGEEEFGDCYEEFDETDMPIPYSLTVSDVFKRIERATSLNDLECLICMDNQIDVSLPCAHSFCSKCINMWHDTNKTCPICRDVVEKPEDCWEFTELPDLEEINQKLISLASGNSASGAS